MKCVNIYPKPVVITCLFLSQLILFFPSTCASKGPIDLNKTLSYIKRLEKRDDFPVSVTFAYYYLKSLHLLNVPIKVKSKVQITRFLIESQHRSGGFGEKPGGLAPPTLVATYFALAALDHQGETKKINKRGAIKYLLGLKNKDGGFSFKKGQPSSLSATYYALMSLKYLDSLNKIDREVTTLFVKKFLHPSTGGFSALPEIQPNLRATYWAYHCLKAIDRLDPSTQKGIAKFMASTRYARPTPKKAYGFPKVDEAAMVYEVLRELDALERVDMNSAVAFIKGLYIPFNGGFGPLPGYGSTPPSTYHALRALYYLGELSPKPLSR